ncbi:hypothetical protein D3C86_1583810 [compost metagenome]
MLLSASEAFLPIVCIDQMQQDFPGVPLQLILPTLYTLHIPLFQHLKHLLRIYPGILHAVQRKDVFFPNAQNPGLIRSGFLKSSSHEHHQCNHCYHHQFRCSEFHLHLSRSSRPNLCAQYQFLNQLLQRLRF